MIPVGTRHQVTVQRTVEVPFRCTHCGFRTLARVRSEGIGERGAPLFVGMGRAIDKATSDAETDLNAAATDLAAGAKCPACGRFDASARRLTKVLGLVAPVGMLAGAAVVDFLLLHAPWPMTTLIALPFAGWLTWSTRW